MTTQVGKLKQKRAQIRGQVTRIHNFFEGNEVVSLPEAQIRLKRLEEAFSRFELVQDEIEEATGKDEEGSLDTDGEAERQRFEESYYRTAAKAQEIIDSYRQPQQQQNLVQDGNNNGNQGTERSRPKLPEIKLPEFNGEYTKWMFFKDSFETTIHQDRGLTAMQKHQYLIGVLQGEARSVIQGFKISNENYENAWTLLKETYDNKMMIIQTHLDELLEFPTITKDKKADSIRQFIWHIQTHVSSLKTLAQPVDHWETLIIHLAKKKLDFSEQRDWQNLIKDRTPENMPRMTEFLKFLTDRCHTIRVLEQGKPKVAVSGKQTTQKRVALLATTAKCKYCNELDHPIYKCEELLKLPATDRMRKIVEKKLCINCFAPGHFVRDCKGSTCKKCGKKHNSLLHREREEHTGQEISKNDPVITRIRKKEDESITEGDSIAMNVFCVQKPTARVILSTVQIYVRDADGNLHLCRGLLDPGSQLNLITTNLVRKLKLMCKDERRPISGINQVTTSSRKTTRIQIKSTHSDFATDMECLVLPTITEQLPQTRIDVTKIYVPKDAQLADPAYDTPGPIEILIGAGMYWKLLVGSPRNRLDGQPALQNTHLGLIIGGQLSDSANSMISCHLVTNTDLHQQIERFWAQETVPENNPYSKEEQACEKQFSDTASRDQNGRFIVRLPIMSDAILGDSMQRALERFKSLEKRLDRDVNLKSDYHQFMQDYVDRGHMSLVLNCEEFQPSETYFIPHQPIVRPDSITTKLRVVFDASAKTTLGTSLNDKLLPGPNLQQDLTSIAIRFRTHQFVLTADITMMFRQILVDPRDRRFQLILWRTDKSKPVRVFQLNTVTYGTNCAPFQAMRCLRELANIYRNEFPRAAKAIYEDSYMDDFLTGGPTLEYVVELQRELSELLMRGQFPLRKWRSNDPRAIQHLAEKSAVDDLLIIDKEEAFKTLGLYWNAASDELQYQVDAPRQHGNSKRNVLSKIAKVYDPLGLVGPILITGKLLMQQLWRREIEWDQTLPSDIKAVWDDYCTSLPRINELKITRNVNLDNYTSTIDLYGFGDASERAFGACIYAVSTDRQGNIQSHLICAKSKVAPLKTISLPRLELEAALLVSQLYNTVEVACGDKIGKVRLWSDSTITLGWIKTPPCDLKTFVANRVAKIQILTEHAIWQHVPSEENPADLLSRGVSAEDLKKSDLWWHGPPWLKSELPYPAIKREPERDLPELKVAPITLIVTTTTRMLTRYSSFSKLCRIVAYCHRWNPKNKKRTGPIETDELERAEKTVVRLLQGEVFSEEIRCLRGKGMLPRKSKLTALNPFVDDEGMIRVGGRLRHAEIALCQKHPFVLPAQHHVTTLIMRERHERLLHCPPGQLLHDVRQRFWPISGRREAWKVVKRCFKCFRFKPNTPEVIMGDIPAERVRGFVRPFTSTGVDYAGPLQIRESRRRGRTHISKGYVAVFTCFSTKAVHLEIVTSLTTEAFIAALNRFTARRGLCTRMFSDNGTNFVGAAREIEEIYRFLTERKAEIKTQLAKQRIEWKFIPPRSPHFGGLWEAAVKIMKRHLNTVTQGQVLTYEEYSTLLATIEAVLNSRPLTPISNDPIDFTVLTPSHFLIGDSLMQPVQHNFLETADNRLSRWQYVQKRGQLFWKRWQSEYLCELQRRSKWTDSGTKVQINQLVLLKEDHLPSLQWARGRITEVHPGPDGEVRVATVRTQNRSFKRSVKKLCLLPMDDAPNA